MATSQITRSDSRPAKTTRVKEGDEIAVSSFVLGLIGLFFFNIVLGPLAVVLGGVSLARGTKRRGRALLGIALGLADLVVLVAMVATHHGGFSWHPGI